MRHSSPRRALPHAARSGKGSGAPDVGTAWIAAVLTQVLLALSSKSLSRAGLSYGHDCWPRSPVGRPLVPVAKPVQVSLHTWRCGFGRIAPPRPLSPSATARRGRLFSWPNPFGSGSSSKPWPPELVAKHYVTAFLGLGNSGPHPLFPSLQLSSLLSYSRRRIYRRKEQLYVVCAGWPGCFFRLLVLPLFVEQGLCVTHRHVRRHSSHLSSCFCLGSGAFLAACALPVWDVQHTHIR